jgi:ABC-2 type transport system permease protein
MFLLLVLSQIVAALGWGGHFPWSVPALSSGVAGPEAARLGFGSYLLVACAGLAGIAGTLAWWRFADQS